MKIILSILLFCSILLADRDGGPYIGLGYGLSEYSDAGVYKELNKDDSAASLYYGGAYINKYFSVELASVRFNYANSYDAVNDSDEEKYIYFDALTVSTLVHYAFFDDILDFYAKCGVGEISANVLSDKGFTMVYGTGIGLRFTKSLSMKVAYETYMFDYEKTDATIKEMRINLVYTAIEYQF